MLTWLEINKRAVESNIRAFRKIVGQKMVLMPVVKANAYGHGLVEIATLCAKNKEVDALCVVSLDEALTLRAQGIKKPLVVLGIYELDEKTLTQAVRQKIVLPLYTIEQARTLNKVAKKIRRSVTVHLKIDTGTSRIGVLPSEAVAFAMLVKKTCPEVIIDGLWSHFSSSEDNAQVTKQQLAIFEKVRARLAEVSILPTYCHMACSASTALYPQTVCNAVRFGIGLYGLHPSKATTEKIQLTPVLSWKTTIIQVKTVPKGTAVSYGRTFITKKTTKLAVLPVGYYDGLWRSWSNKASVLIKGRRCPIRGRVCMNVTMVDVTAVPGVKAGDRVTLLGRDGGKHIAAEELAQISDTINYEIVTKVGGHLPRIIV
jgi:alanine racemase